MIECLVAAAIAFVVVLLATGPFARWVRNRRWRREVRVDTPASHQAKQGTPSMGGVVLCGAVTLGTVLACPDWTAVVPVGVLLTFAALGFWDDWIKATARPGFGVKARYKFLLQVLLATAAVWSVAVVFGADRGLHVTPTTLAIRLGWVYFPFAGFIVLGTSNAANIVDGLDGLAAGVLGLAFAGLAGMTAAEGGGSLAAAAGAAAGACVAFLWFNHHPARIFMGDTGSLALGALLAVVALAGRKELLLLPLGVVLVIDALSVILQVVSFQTTGRRIFRMAPIHHALELRGWSEPRVVTAAWLLTGMGVAAATAVWGASR